MQEREISEEEQIILSYAIDRLYSKYDTVQDVAKDWILFGPCIERCPKPEIHRPWTFGLGVLSDS